MFAFFKTEKFCIYLPVVVFVVTFRHMFRINFLLFNQKLCLSIVSIVEFCECCVKKVTRDNNYSTYHNSTTTHHP